MRRSDYPENWEEISERIRFERANNRCEWCGAENYKPHPVTGSRVILTVAHWNHDKMDVRDENLAALCQRCHLSYDHDRHVRNARATRDARKGPPRPTRRQPGGGKMSFGVD